MNQLASRSRDARALFENFLVCQLASRSRAFREFLEQSMMNEIHGQLLGNYRGGQTLSGTDVQKKSIHPLRPVREGLHF